MNKQINNEKTDILSKNLIVCFLAFICCALWGSAFPCVKIGYKMMNIASDATADQILYAGIRFTVAGLMVILYGSIAQKKFLKPSVKEIPRVAALSSFQTIIQYLLFYIGLAHTSGVKSSIIIGSNVFIAVIVSGVIFRLEKVTGKKILGCIIGFAGIVLINMNGASFDLNFSLTGEGFMFISTISYALSSILMKKYSVTSDPMMMSGWQFLFGGLVMAGVSIAAGGHISFSSPEHFAMLAYLSFISAAAYSIWAILLKHNPVSKVAVYGFMNPVIGVILSAVLLKESGQASGINAVGALILVCIGIYIVNFSKTSDNK